MLKKTFLHLFFYSTLTFITLQFGYAQITITANNSSGIYKTGDIVNWTLDYDTNIINDSLRYTIKKGGLTIIKEGSIYKTQKKAVIGHYLEQPGAVLLEVSYSDENNKEHKFLGGAIASPEEIKLSAEKPLDFDAFWESQIKSLTDIPKNTKLKREHVDSKDIKYYHITMDNINGSKIRGQLARPKKGKKLPALLIVQWAGVYPLQKTWVEDKAEKGWLVLNINAHDLPINNDKSFYKEKADGVLLNYPSIGNETKNTSYFLRMYLSCYRAAQYLSERPDWNGETLVVMGTSQGGLQSLMTAGIHPKITASLALVPAGFDQLGPTIGRKGGWPHWYYNTENKDAQKVHEVSCYFDIANFVTRIKCPVLVGIGLIDETCPPEGIYAGLNQLETPKEIILLPKSGHQDKNGSQLPYVERAEEDWLPSLLKGHTPVTTN